METPEFGQATPAFDYRGLVRGIWRRHKLLVVVVFLVIATPGLLFVYYTNTPLYLSRAMIAIEPAALSQLPFLREPPRRDTIAAHMVLLKSRSLTEGVLEALPQATYAELLAKRQHIDYLALAKNWIKVRLGKTPTVLSPREQALSELQLGRMEFSPLREAENVFTISATATQPRVAMDLVNTYIQVLLNRARSVDHAEAKRAREFLETQYQQVKETLARAEESAGKLQRQRGYRSGAQSELELVRLAQLESNLADTQANRQILSSRIEGLRRALDEARSQEAKARADDRARESQQSDQAAGTTPAADYRARTAAYTTAQEQLARMEAKLASLRERYTEAHPQVQIAREEVARQQAKVTQLARNLPAEPQPTRPGDRSPAVPATASDRLELQRELASAQRESDTLAAREESLKLQVARLRGSLQNLSPDEAEFGNLRRSIEANRNLLAVLSDRLMAARIREQGDSSVIRIVDPASFPAETTTPGRVQRLLLMVFALAGGVAVGLAAGVEFLRQPLETETDVAKATGLRVLGSIGTMDVGGPSKNGRRDHKPILLPSFPTGASAAQSRSIHVELYRAIRARIETERLKAPFRSILVTSPSPHEGKSTSTLNLAHAFQGAGRRVLLVEADLRRPSLASPLALTNKPGIVDYLHGVATLEQVCRRLPSGVTVIPGQVAHGDTVSLLESPRFKELLRDTRNEFDLILIDSAPILAVPDNILLVNIVDRVILVARATKTTARELRKAKVALEESGGRILGVLLNQANPRDVPYYHPRYRKYYTPTVGKNLQGASRRPVSTPPAEGRKGAGALATRDEADRKSLRPS